MDTEEREGGMGPIIPGEVITRRVLVTEKLTLIQSVGEMLRGRKVIIRVPGEVRGQAGGGRKVLC